MHARRQWLLRVLDSVPRGELTLHLPDGAVRVIAGDQAGTRAELVLKRWAVLDAILIQGDIGFGEAFMAGDWETPDLIALMRFATENLAVFDAVTRRSRWLRALDWLRHHLLRNTLRRSRVNVHRHYDLGNDFYRLWLDDSMTYSGALFESEAMSLEAAQQAKYARIVRRLQVPEGARLLEIGCGWGGFMAHAAEQGLQIAGVTLSTEQAEYARQRLAAAGLSGQTDVQLRDYREVTGEFDGVVSIGMFEHVGEDYWRTYLADVLAFLKPGACAVIQSIFIREGRFERYRNGNDFLRQHIFPGGMLPTQPGFVGLAQQAGLAVNDVFTFGHCYALTLEHWYQRFMAQLDAVRALGYDETFVRKWRFYLAACAGMFRAGEINLMQVELQRPAGFPAGRV